MSREGSPYAVIHSRVCGSEPGFGNRGFMISVRPLQFIAWSPGIVRAQTFRDIYPF